MELWQLYFLVMLPRLSELANITFAFLIVAGGFGIISVPMLSDIFHVNDILTKMRRPFRFWIIAVIASGVTSVAIPSERGLYIIVGGYYATNIDGISDLPPNVVKAANAFLESYAKEKSAE